MRILAFARWILIQLLRNTGMLLALLVGAAAICASAQEKKESDLSGAWILKFTSPNGDKIRLPLTLKQEGEKLTGKMRRPDGTETVLDEGLIKEGLITFSIQQQRNQRTVTSKYQGKLEGEQIKGTFESNFGGNSRTLGWEASRKRNDATGVWKWTFTREDGQPVEFTLKLKEEKNQLSGLAISPSGSETPITSPAAQNNELSFKVIRERDDKRFTTTFSGKRTDDVITGKIEADWTGENKTYDWTAKRISEDW